MNKENLEFLDYTKDLNVPLFYHEKLLWPCYEYNCVIKRVSESDENLFNLYILKLLDIEKGIDDKEISRLMGIPLEFVRLCLDNLVFSGYLENDYQTLTPSGIEKKNTSLCEREVNYHFYLDYYSHKPLPFIEEVEEKKKNMEHYPSSSFYKDFESGRIDYYIHSSDELASEEAIKKHCYMLDVDKNDICSYPLDNFDIYEKDIKKVLVSSHLIPPSAKIKIDKEESSHLVYRMIDLVIQKGDKGHVYASNGKGELSSFFTYSLSSPLLPKRERGKIDNLVQKALSSTRLSNNSKEDKEKEHNIKAFLDPKLQNINESVKRINLLFYSLLKGKDIKSEDERLKKEEKRRELTSLIFSFTENALYYIAKNDKTIPLNLSLDKVGDTKYENKEKSVRIAKKMGFNIPKQNEGLFLIEKGKIVWSVKNTPSLFPLLTSLLFLSEEDSSYFFNSFVKEEKDPFILVLKDIKDKRDKVGHNEKDVSGGDLVLYKDWSVIKNRILPLIEDAYIKDLVINKEILEKEKEEIGKDAKEKKNIILLHLTSTIENLNELLSKKGKDKLSSNYSDFSEMKDGELASFIEKVVEEIKKEVKEGENIQFLNFYEDKEDEEKENKVLSSYYKELGLPIINNISLELSNALKKIYEYSAEEDNVKSAIIVKLYILYSLLFELLKESVKDEMETSSLVSIVPSCYKDDVLELQRIIKREKVRKELSGKNVSLEPCVLAYLQREDREELKRMGEENQLLLKDIREISKYRGHTKLATDEEILGYKEKDYRKMKKEVSIKLLGYKDRAIHFLKYMARNGYFG